MARRPGVKKAKRTTAGKPRARAPKRAAPRRAVKLAAKRPATGKKATSSKRPAAANPLLIEVTRGEMVESRHRVAIAIVDARGKTVESWGDISRPIYARSAIKMLQALPLLETGAADRYALSDHEIALACASHNGEVEHTDRVAGWLARIGLSPADLECGPQLPYDDATALRLIANGGDAAPIFNNCSGKHSGFLTTARHRKEPTKGYIRADHPVQQRVKRALEAMGEIDLSRASSGIDGCGIPVIGIPLRAMALALARMADPGRLPDERRAASARIVAAIGRAPAMLGGRGRFGTQVMQATGGRMVLKGGAEGVYAAILPSLGLGVALKADDGAGRAAETAMARLLVRLRLLSEAESRKLVDLLTPPVFNRAGLEVGRVRPAAGAGF